LRSVVAVALSTLGHVVARAAVTTAASMQRETVALTFVAVLPVALLRLGGGTLRRRAASAGDEGRQALHIAVVVAAMGRGILRMATAEALLLARKVRLLARRIEMRVARQIGLRIARTEERLFADARHCSRLIVAILAHVVTIVASVRAVAEERRRLTELFLRCCDQAKIMLGVLEIVLGRNRISRRLRVAGKLHVFFRNV